MGAITGDLSARRGIVSGTDSDRQRPADHPL